MPFDCVLLKAVTRELNETLTDTRVDKLHQPTRDTVILHLRGRQGSFRLLLCANPGYPRLHITQMTSENPPQPPRFCMLLRKHLSGAKLLYLEQAPMERCVSLHFSCTDEMGVQSEKQLVAELMGRTSNLILVDEEGLILDCLRRVDFTMSERRPVLPGLRYTLPPRQEGKEDPSERIYLPEEDISHYLLSHYYGLSPLLCRELACYPRERIPGKLSELLAGGWKPILLRYPDGKGFDFYCIPIRQYGDALKTEEYDTFSQMLDAFYAARDNADRLRQKSQALMKTLTNHRDRLERKLAHQRQELAETENRERWRQLGDIVTANLYQIERGQVRLTAVDFYDPEMKPIDIPLNPALSPQKNAAKFYKDYAKAKTARKVLTEQIAKGEEELAYLLSVIDSLKRAEGDRDLQEIREELLQEGYLQVNRGAKRMRLPPAKPMAFLSSDGFPIFVGRNSRQNDELTLHTAEKNDIWLHVQKLPGSHVIISCHGQTPPDTTMTEAMELAAYFSSARQGQGVPVDATWVKNVKKPSGAKPGMVTYVSYHTGYVNPSEATAERLRLPERV